MLNAQVFQQFLAAYNHGVFPAHVGFYLIGLAAAAYVFIRPGKWGDIAAKGALAILWTWVGVFYFFIHYGRVNSAGYTLGVISLLQALYFLIDIFHNKTVYRPANHPKLGYLGAGLAGWAFVGYPVTALILGRGWPDLQLAGIAQLGIFTCGMLMFTLDRKPKWRFTFFPVLFAFVLGLGPATQWRYFEDYTYFAAGIVLLFAWMWASNKYKEKKKKK
jgi:hypothetical protein